MLLHILYFAAYHTARQLPFLCRVFAFLLAAPVALFITLDLIAYGE